MVVDLLTFHILVLAICQNGDESNLGYSHLILLELPLT